MKFWKSNFEKSCVLRIDGPESFEFMNIKAVNVGKNENIYYIFGEGILDYFEVSVIQFDVIYPFDIFTNTPYQNKIIDLKETIYRSLSPAICGPFY